MKTFTVLHVHLILITLCGSKNYPYLPHGRDFSLDSPTSLEIPVSKASYIDLNFWAFENPPPPRNFQSLLWGEYGYFLKLHISRSIPLVMFGRFKHNLLLFPWRSSSKADAIQYNTITLFKEGSAITCYSFLTYGPQIDDIYSAIIFLHILAFWFIQF